MCPLKSVSDRAHEIEANAPTGGTTPGVAEQHMKQIARLREGSANAEYITYPGFMSFPSKLVEPTLFGSLLTLTIEPFNFDTYTRLFHSRRKAHHYSNNSQPAVFSGDHPRNFKESA